MRNFTKIAKLHRMFFKRADRFNSYESGEEGQGKYKPSPPSGNALGGPAPKAAPKAAPKPVPNADDWLGHVRSRNTRANSNITVTPTPGSASGHEVMTFEPNSRISPIPPKRSPVTIHQNQRLTPKPWAPRKPREHSVTWTGRPEDMPDDSESTSKYTIGESDSSWAADSAAIQREAQINLASPYGHLQSNGEVLQGFRYPPAFDTVEGTYLPRAVRDFKERSLGNLPKLPPHEEARIGEPLKVIRDTIQGWNPVNNLQ